MATIEERAYEYAPNTHSDTDYGECDYNEELRDGYIQGATDQRNIDIFKALEWMKNNLNCDTASFVWAMADFKKYMQSDD